MEDNTMRARGSGLPDLAVQSENKAMQYVLAIERHRNITRAAQELYISQPSLSKFLKNLEGRLGFPIFNRLGNRLIPSLEGEVYIAYARRICDLEDRMCNELTDLLHANRGRLRLALPMFRSSYILPYIVPPFKRMYPGVEIQVQEHYSRMLKGVLLRGEVDFAILNSMVDSADVYEEVIRVDKVLLAVPSGHPMAPHGAKPFEQYPVVALSRFAGDEFVLQPPDQRTRQVADLLFAEARFSPRVLLVTKSIESSLKLVAEGCGLCFVAETHLRHIAPRGGVAYFAVDNPAAALKLAFAYIKGVYQPAYFQDFVEILREKL